MLSKVFGIFCQFLLFAVISGASFNSSSSEDQWEVCDLSSFTCVCGEIDVIGCRCIELPRDCPENFIYIEEICDCKFFLADKNDSQDLSMEINDSDSSVSSSPSNFTPMESSKLLLEVNNSLPSSELQSSSSRLINITEISSKLLEMLTSNESQWPSESCYIPECRSCDELDEVNCICYQSIIECLPGYFLSSDGCDCIRDNSTSISTACPGLVCTNHLKVNEAKCTCSHDFCDPNLSCEHPQLLDIDTCMCVCSLSDWNCPRNQFIDRETCDCREPQCEPFFPCPDGTEWNVDACTCQCQNPPNCTSDLFIFDPYTCSCVCANSSCDSGYIASKLTCDCVPEHEPLCPPHFVYDPILCRCICQAFHECPFNFVWDENKCQCVCPHSIVCESDMIWSEQHCDCICSSNKTCQKNFIFDEKSCDCICDPKLTDDFCENGFMLDRTICECVKGIRPSCPTGFVYSEVDCGCICEKIEECNGSGIFDHDSCKCVCMEKNKECHGGVFDEERCECIGGIPEWMFG